MPGWLNRLDILTALKVRAPRGRTSSDPWQQPLAPAYIYLLADNLDAALAAGEDLLKEQFEWTGAALGTPKHLAALRSEQRASIETIRTLEMVLISRVLKSRERAEELGRRDERFRIMAKLYAAGTAILIEAAAECGNPHYADFETGGSMSDYLRERGMLTSGVHAPHDGALVHVTGDFLIAKRIPLGGLLDLVGEFLDKLETHYNLYEVDDAAASV